MKMSWALALLSTIILELCAVPANAASNRTWVSGTGSDLGPCTIASPCATFQVALNNTAAGGEVDCLSPGDFGGVSGTLTISQSVSIVCGRVSNGGIFTSTTNNAVTINAGANAVVYLSGLDLSGLVISSSSAFFVNSGLTVYIVHCTVRNFAGNGVYVNDNANAARVVVKDSIIINNNEGVTVEGDGGGTNAAIIADTIIDGNRSSGATAVDSASVLSLQRTLLTGGSTGLSLQDGASGVLIGPSNTIAGAVVGSPTSVPFK
jgi:hypothetical protein